MQLLIKQLLQEISRWYVAL